MRFWKRENFPIVLLVVDLEFGTRSETSPAQFGCHHSPSQINGRINETILVLDVCQVRHIEYRSSQWWKYECHTEPAWP